MKNLKDKVVQGIRKGPEEPKAKSYRKSHVPFRLNFFVFYYFCFVCIFDRSIRLSTDRQWRQY